MEQQTACETDIFKEADVSSEREKSELKQAIMYVGLTSLF
jgi:hypothetical protein